jgi:phage terminase large subunit-like protein
MPRTKKPRIPQTVGEKVCAFIESECRVPEGALVGQPIKLAPFQRDFILAIYDNSANTRRAYLSIARKNGKTALIACLLIAHLVGPVAVENSQIVSGARSRDQAGLVFDLASKMIKLNPKLAERIRDVPSQKRLVSLTMGVEYRAISAEGRTAHGLSPVLAILDEVGQVVGPQDAFIDAIETSQGAHAAPLLIAISTQAPTDADLFSLWLEDAKKSSDPRIVSHVYTAPPDADVLDESAWRLANPGIGLFRSLDDMRELAKKASRMPSFENTFRNLNLNARVTAISPFISRSVWESCGFKPSPMIDQTVFVGLDLSARTDLTAAVAVWHDDGCWHVGCRFWTPREGLRERAKNDRVPYDVWVRDGHLITTPGRTVDYAVVAADILDWLSDCEIAAIAYDRWRIDLMKKEFSELGVDLPMVSFGQGFRDMSPALDTLEADLLNQRISHGSHPVLTWCAANAIAVRDPAGNRKLDKSKTSGRIDGMVALVMARGVADRSAEDEGGSIDDYLAAPVRLY